MRNWNLGWERTQWTGVYVRGDACRIRARVVDPRSGRLREANRILRGVAPEQALDQRQAMREGLEAKLREPPRRRVDEFGRYWLGIKKAAIDPGTYERYKAALEDDAFKSLGRIQFEDLRGLQIQEWINKELRASYRASTVKGWFRAFRTMVRDAMDDLALTHDPTRRVCFPVAEERAEANALLPDQLARFLEEMKSRFPQHYPLAATLALTGLRFCHASALRWEDFDRRRAFFVFGAVSFDGVLDPSPLSNGRPRNIRFRRN
jgi:integrase